MKRFAYTLILSLLICSQAFGANFYWKSSLSELNAITGVTNADKAVVMSSDNMATFYSHASGAWAEVGVNTSDIITKGPWVDVRAYGANLSTTNGTDEWASAIQAAHDALPASGGGILLGGAGNKFRISTTINISKKVRFMGWGRNDIPGAVSPTTIIKASSLNGNAIYVTGNRSVLEGFTVEGEVGNGGDGISINANGVYLRDISVHRMGNDGVRVGLDAVSGNSNSWQMQFVTSDNNIRHGFNFHSGNAGCNAGTGIHLEARNNGVDGIRLATAYSNTFVGGLAETNLGTGVYLASDAMYNTFVGGDFDETNVTRDLYIASGANNNHFLWPALTGSRTLDDGLLNVIMYSSGNDPSQLQDVTVKSFYQIRAPNLELTNGANDNVADINGSLARITGPTDNTWVITGIVAPSNPNHRITLINGSGYAGAIAHDNTGSGVANRIYCPGATNLAIRVQGAVELIYDDGSSRWQVIQQ